jgi:hypothetical protein
MKKLLVSWLAVPGGLALVVLGAACGNSKDPPPPTKWSVIAHASPPNGGTQLVDGGDGASMSALGAVSFNCKTDMNLNVSVTAKANPGFRFDHWEDDCSGTTGTVELTFLTDGMCDVDQHKTCTAVYVPIADGGIDDMGAPPSDMSAGCGDMGCVALPATNHTTGINKPLTAGGVAHDDYIIVGDKGALATSTDGITWTVGSFGAYSGISFGGVAASPTAANRYVAVGAQVAGVGGNVFYSPDAKSWTQANGPSNAIDVTWDGNRYVTAGQQGEVCTSSDGATWACATVGVLGSAYPTRIIFTGKTYVMVGINSMNTGLVATSPDTSTWMVQASAAAATGNTIFGVAFANGMLVASTWAGPNGPDVITSTDEGKTWTRQPSATAAAMTFGKSTGLGPVGWTGTWWVAGGGVQILSKDGVTWQAGAAVSNSSPLAMTTAGPRGLVALLGSGNVVTVEK